MKIAAPSRLAGVLLSGALGLTWALNLGAATAAGPVIPDDVKASVTTRVDAGLTPGIVVGMIGPGGESYFTYGVRHVGRPEAVDADTIFEIGSITKAFTGILLAEMVRRGEVALNDPVAKYLPETVKLPTQDGRAITLEDLATHRSGLPRMPDNMAPADPLDPYADYSVERLYTFLGTVRLDRAIGSRYEYSNLGVGLLGHALGRAAKSNYGKLVRERVAVPLGMKHTALTVDAEALPLLAQAHAVPGATAEPTSPWTWEKADAIAGAGGLRSTAREMLHFVAASAGLVESPLAAAMAEAQRPRADAGSPQMRIGLGWHVRQSGERSIVWHNGGTGGFRSFTAFDPAQKVGVVVLGNSTTAHDDIGFHLLDPGSPLKAIEQPVSVDPVKLARLVGHYDLGGATLHVTQEGSQLYTQLTGQDRFPVFPKSESRFFLRVVEAELEFAIQPDGSVPSVTLYQGGNQIVARRIDASKLPPARTEISLAPELLAEYAGRYEFAPGLTLDVVARDGRLACQLTGQPRIEVYAESETKFFYKVVEAQLTFVRGESGRVEAVILHQGGIDQRARRLE